MIHIQVITSDLDHWKIPDQSSLILNYPPAPLLQPLGFSPIFILTDLGSII